MKLKAQNLVEYGLIATVVALALFGAMRGVNFKKLKNYVFMRPADSTGSVIEIESMTGEN